MAKSPHPGTLLAAGQNLEQDGQCWQTPGCKPSSPACPLPLTKQRQDRWWCAVKYLGTYLLFNWILIMGPVLFVLPLDRDRFNTIVDIPVDIYLKRAIAKDCGENWS